MSKVYEVYLQMEELCQDIGWQERQEELERLAREENYGFSEEEMCNLICEDCRKQCETAEATTCPFTYETHD